MLACMLIRNASVWPGDGPVTDVRITGGAGGRSRARPAGHARRGGHRRRRRRPAVLAAAVADGTVAQRVYCMAPVHARSVAGVRLGPVKILLDDDTLPPLHELADHVRRAHGAGRPVAVHCVTRVQFVLTLAALDMAGRLTGDRIEHGAVIPAESMGDLGVSRSSRSRTSSSKEASSTPPTSRRRTCLTCGGCAPSSRRGWGWRRGATRRSAMRTHGTSCGRRRGGRPGLGPDEAIPPARALDLFLGEPAAPATPRRVAPGCPADLVLLRCPPEEAARSLTADLVAMTFVAGGLVYARPEGGNRAHGEDD